MSVLQIAHIQKLKYELGGMNMSILKNWSKVILIYAKIPIALNFKTKM